MADGDILLITGGLAAPLVTETLYRLGQDAKVPRVRDPFWPRRVIVAGTSANRERFEAGPLKDQIDHLCLALHLPRPALTFETPEGDIRDVRTAAEAEAFGDLIARLVRRITADPNTRLHVSLAGGRKTMSFHAGAALSLYGRDKDTLSHVLVEPEAAERAANFWFPTLTDLMLVDREARPLFGPDGEQLNARDAQVDKANIPYVSVRHLLPRSLLARDLRYGEVTKLVRMALGQASITVTLDRERREVVVSGLPPIRLAPQLFAFYQLLCERAREGAPGVGPEGEGPDRHGWLSDRLLKEPHRDEQNPVARYLAIHEHLRGPGSQVADVSDKKSVHEDTSVRPSDNSAKASEAAKDESDRREKDNLDHFRPLRSRLKKAFEVIANARVRKALYDEIEDGGGVRYGLDLPSGNISNV